MTFAEHLDRCLIPKWTTNVTFLNSDHLAGRVSQVLQVLSSAKMGIVPKLQSDVRVKWNNGVNGNACKLENDGGKRDTFLWSKLARLPLCTPSLLFSLVVLITAEIDWCMYFYCLFSKRAGALFIARSREPLGTERVQEKFVEWKNSTWFHSSASYYKIELFPLLLLQR